MDDLLPGGLSEPPPDRRFIFTLEFSWIIHRTAEAYCHLIALKYWIAGRVPVRVELNEIQREFKTHARDTEEEMRSEQW